MHAFRTYRLFLSKTATLQHGLSAIADLLVIIIISNCMSCTSTNLVNEHT